MLSSQALTVLSFALAAVVSVAKPAEQAPLQIQILNVQKNSGKLVVEIYKDNAAWLKAPFRRVTLSTTEDYQKAVFEVPYGKYAVCIYQDTNQNGKLDQNFLGIPKEPIGFGNNYRPFGKPSFESAVVEYKPASKIEAIKLFSVL